MVEARLIDREGKAVTNFNAALPPSDSDMAAQSFKIHIFSIFLAWPIRDARLMWNANSLPTWKSSCLSLAKDSLLLGGRFITSVTQLESASAGDKSDEV